MIQFVLENERTELEEIQIEAGRRIWRLLNDHSIRDDEL